MKYFKSTLVGIVAMFVICGVIPALVPLCLFLIREMRSGGVGIASGHFTWHAPTLRDVLFLLSAFGLGFFWELRRVERRQLPAAKIEFH